MPKPPSNLVDRIKLYSTETINGCWKWNKQTDRDGYGHIKVNGKDWLAHRLSYELFIGKIQTELTIDHLCRNTGCVNPSHMEPVTNKENIMRGYGVGALHARQTHCHRGHPFSGDNLYRYKNTRNCKKCNCIRTKKYENRKVTKP